jgi:5-methylcytosine-specific restriction endonuclease McrA
MSMAALRSARGAKDRRREALRAARALGRHSDADWHLLQEVCNGTCVACGARAGRDLSLTRDHIVPVSRGGSDAIENIQPLCLRCNVLKGAAEWGDLRPAGWREWMDWCRKQARQAS